MLDLLSLHWKFIDLPPPYSAGTDWCKAAVKEKERMQGACPNCNTMASTYFGDILTITGNREKNEITCSECKAKLVFNSTKGQARPPPSFSQFSELFLEHLHFC